MTHVGVHVQQTQIQPSLVTNLISISQYLSWLQLITPLIAKQPKIVLYLMWYNIVPYFVPMDPKMFSMYYSRIKGPNPLTYGKNKRDVIGVTQPKPMPPIKQPVFITRDVLIQQTMAMVLPINVLVTKITYLW